MTIPEAAKLGIARVRLAQWGAPTCYLKLYLIPDGTRGIWAKLYDRLTQEVIGAETPQKVLATDSGDGWEEYTGPLDSEDV